MKRLLIILLALCFVGLINEANTHPLGGGMIGGGTSGSGGADPTFTGIVTFPIAADPTTDADGEMSFDADGWGAGYDALEIWNGTASGYCIATTASDTPANGEVPTFNTGGEITWNTIRDFAKTDMTNGDTQTALSEANMMAALYVSNQGDGVETDIILVAISYPIRIVASVEEATIMELCPPAGEIFDLNGTALHANDCVDSPAIVGSKLVATRLQVAAGTWHWSLDTVRGAWVDTGATD